MPDVSVKVYCKDCDEDGDNDHPEMLGADNIFENEDERTQTRDYECPMCGKIINVRLDYRGN